MYWAGLWDRDRKLTFCTLLPSPIGHGVLFVYSEFVSSRTDSQLFGPVMLDTPVLSLHLALKSEKFVSPDAPCLPLYTHINENPIFCQFRISIWQLLVKNKKMFKWSQNLTFWLFPGLLDRPSFMLNLKFF